MRSNPNSDSQIIVVPHVHWDREWYATYQESRIRLVQTIDHLLDLLEEKPDYPCVVLDGQSGLLEDYLEVRPEKEERLRRLIEARRLQLGWWYVPPDEFLVSGEALIRNLLLGQRIALRFGQHSDSCYLPDTFGHIAQLPQILKGFGIKGFVFWRGLGDEGEKLGQEFIWEGSDGSGVLAVHLIPSYSSARGLGYDSNDQPNFAGAKEQAEAILEHQRSYANSGVFLFPNRDPQPGLPELIEYLGRCLDGKNIRAGTFDDFIAEVKGRTHRFLHYRGEMRQGRYASIYPGTLSARMWIKQKNEQAQTLLERWVEPFCSIAWLEGLPYQGALIRQAWKTLIQNHFHDSICGCSTDAVHDEMCTRFNSSLQIGEMLLQEALEHIAAKINTEELVKHSAEQLNRFSMPVIPLVVFNPTPYVLTDVVEIIVQLPPDWTEKAVPHLALVDHSGNRVSFDLIRRTRSKERGDQRLPWCDFVTLTFVADKVPALGYRTYGIIPSLTLDGPVSVTESDQTSIENEFYLIKARPNGTLRIVDRISGQTYNGINLFEDQGDRGDTYNYFAVKHDESLTTEAQHAKIEKVRLGGVVQVLRITIPWKLPAGLVKARKRRSRSLVRFQIVAEVSLIQGVQRIDFRTLVSNNIRDHRLRVLFPSGIQTDLVSASGQFAVIKRPIELPAGNGWDEYPSPTNHHSLFVDVNNGQRGLALFSRGLPEYEAIREPNNSVTLALTLLRSVGWLSQKEVPTRSVPAGPCIPAPGAQCLGQYVFEYALLPYSGDWGLADIARKAEAFQLSLRALQPGRSPSLRQFQTTWRLTNTADHEKALHPGYLPLEMSFLSLEGGDIMLSTLKQAEDEDGLTLRLYNPAIQPTKAQMCFYWLLASANRARLDETDIEGSVLAVSAYRSIPLSLQGGEILTLRCQSLSR